MCEEKKARVEILLIRGFWLIFLTDSYGWLFFFLKFLQSVVDEKLQQRIRGNRVIHFKDVGHL